MVRELVVLGTAAQAPTRDRNHNGYLLRWDDEAILFDPGEGTQRQLLLAGVPSTAITRICLTHLHGDHCLGLPGVLARMALDDVPHVVPLYFPAEGAEVVSHLLALGTGRPEVRLHPLSADGEIGTGASFSLVARALDHRVSAYGYRVSEPAGRRMLPDRLAASGIGGTAVGELQRAGSLLVGDRIVQLTEVSAPRRGQVFAFVMDTRVCSGAAALAEEADLLVCESTYASTEESLAEAHRHLTAAQAGRIARAAGARRLVLTHFSQRYRDVEVLLAEAAALFPDVVAAHDLMRIPIGRSDA